MYRLDKPLITEYGDLVKIWESSVRATHQFLKEEHLLYFKKLVEEKYLHLVHLVCVRDEQKRIVAFMGVSEDNIEMLFVDASERGKGIGKLLIQHAIQNMHLQKVDVNEQNKQAVGFYQSLGFEVISRSSLDGTGKPYPILHMQMKKADQP